VSGGLESNEMEVQDLLFGQKVYLAAKRQKFDILPFLFYLFYMSRTIGLWFHFNPYKDRFFHFFILSNGLGHMT